MIPRQLIASAAYSYKAESAKEAESVMGEVSVSSSGNVGIGTMSPTTKLEVKGTVTATSFIGDGLSLNGALPKGGIILWSGAIVDIPAGWALCDGSNGTPDLRDKFITGAGNSYGVNSEGGSKSHSHTLNITADGAHTPIGIVQNHTLTVSQIPSHGHSASGLYTSGEGLLKAIKDGRVKHTDATTSSDCSTWRGLADNCNTHTHSILGNTSNAGGGHPHSHGLSMNTVGNHNHQGSIANVENNIPPYYALAYIMKL